MFRGELRSDSFRKPKAESNYVTDNASFSEPFLMPLSRLHDHLRELITITGNGARRATGI